MDKHSLNNTKGKFITFEGPDGCGKSTVVTAIYDWLTQLFPNKVFLTREPGGSNNIIAEDIRNILLNHLDYKINYQAEALLYAASRAQHVHDFILPHIKNGDIVLCDRYVHSSLVYQGYARELGIDQVMKINQFAMNKTLPNLVILIMVKPETSIKRMQNRLAKLDRLDLETSLHNKVYQGYKKLIKKYPNTFNIVNGEKPIDQVIHDTKQIIKKFLKIKHDW